MAIFPGSAIPSGAAAAYEIDNSLRFNDGDSGYLARTPTVAGNRKTWTFSAWVKRGVLTTWQSPFAAYVDASNSDGIWFNADDELAIYINGSATDTTQVFRDPSAWYHIVLAVDTTQGTDTNRVKLYENGEQVTSFSTTNYPAEDHQTAVNNTTALQIGKNSGTNPFDGYLAEVYLIDGTQLAASDFGELSSTTNQWKPLDSDDVKDAVTFGTNGFYQKYGSTEDDDDFEDSADHSIHTMTANGDANTDTAEKKFGTASLVCVGTDAADFLSTPNSDDFMFGTGDFTVELWVYTTNSGVNQYMWGQIRDDGTDEFFSRINTDGKVLFLLKGESSTKQCVSSSALSVSTWYHLAGVRDGDNLRLYIDGVLEDTEAFTSQSQMAPTTIFEVGATPYNQLFGGHSGFSGYIDEFRISNTCRYPSGTTFTPSTTAFTADKYTKLLLHMDGVDGATSFPDSSWTGAPRHLITANGDVKNVRGADLDTTYDTFASFTSTGADTWTCPAGVTSVEVLTVAGGGGGAGYYYGGGGGSGGVVHNSTYSVTAGVVYDLTVGAGGAGGGATTSGTTGSDSVFNVNAEGSGLALTSKGGGGGGSYGAGDVDGKDGGSGGGAGPRDGTGTGGSTNQGSFSGATSYGNAGGSAGGDSGAGSGGGGAGEAGNVDGAPGSGAGGHGGDGVLFSTFTSYGVSGYFAGGGGGGGGSGPSVAGPGGTGGGGNGAAYNSSAAVAGTANSGGGGGAGSYHIGSPSTQNGAAGGSGVVLIMWTLAKPGSSSVYYDGTGDYLSYPNNSDMAFGTGEFTIETWLQPVEEARRSFFAQGADFRFAMDFHRGSGIGVDNNMNVFLSSNGSSWDLMDGDSGGDGVGNISLDLNTWNHVVFQRTGNVFSTYINGVRDINYDAGSAVSVYNGSEQWRVGGTWHVTVAEWKGYTDEVRVSSTARYSGATLTIPRTQFTADANTKLLIHSDYTGGLGADSSGNYNNFTATNLVATDQCVDVPTNNFATWNPLSKRTDGSQIVTLLEGNLKCTTVSVGGAGANEAAGTIAMGSGKWYAEMEVISMGSGSLWLGISNSRFPQNEYIETGSWIGVYYRTDSGQKSVNGTTTSYGAATVAGDVVGIAYNGDDNEVTFYKNDVSQGVISITADEYVFACGKSSGNPSWVANFGSDSSFAGNKTAQGNQDGNSKGDFYYAPPTDYLAVCADNLPDPEIALPADHFETILWTGDGTSGAMSTTGLSFQPDFFFQGCRAGGGGGAHLTYDAVRGFGNDKELTTNSSGAEGAENADEYGYVSGVTSDGVTYAQGSLGAGSGIVYYNTSSAKYVSWNWKGDGVAGGTLNEDGSLDSQVNVNTTAGFSIVKYSGVDTPSTNTVGHGLGVVPELYIIKSSTAASPVGWVVNTTVIDGTVDYMFLNTIAAKADQGSPWSTLPTTSVFTLGANDGNTCNDGVDYVAYCFRSIEGYSKVGAYPGNGNADGPFIYLGFRPAWIIAKGYAGTDDWIIMDSKREGYNSNNDYLDANNATAETDGSGNIDFCSNGFKVRSSFSSINYATGAYLYVAFAESPFKTSNAR